MRRSTAGQQDFGIYDFSGGLNIKSAPQELEDNELTNALNGYLRPDGGFESRRGMDLYTRINVAAPVNGLFRFVQGVKAGVATTVKQTIAQVGNHLYDLDTKKNYGLIASSSNATTLPWSVTLASDPQGNPYNYKLPASNPDAGYLTDVAVICVGGMSGPYIFDGGQTYHPSGWKNAHGAQWCQIVNGVVWFGGIPNFPTQVMSTGTGISPDVSFEKIAGYAIFDLGVPVTGLGVVGSGAQAMLAVGLPNGLALIYGTGPANYTVQMVPMDNDGVASGYTMISNNGTLYFLGNNNVYAFNPLTMPSPQPLSLKVQPWITNDPFTTGFPMNGTRSNFFAFVYYDRYHLCYSSANANVYDTMLVLDTNIGGWTVNSLGTAITSATLIDAPGDPSPWAILTGGALGRTFTWDAYAGFSDSVWGMSNWNSSIWDDTTEISDAGANISTWVATKYFKVGEPGTAKTLHRVYPEIMYPATFGGTLTVQTDYGEETIFSTSVAAMAAGGALWDVAIWDSAIWQSYPAGRASWNAPESRIDLTTQVPGYIGQFVVWNVSDWNVGPWGSNPLPTTNAPGIQAEAFAIGMQSGFNTTGGIWDQAIWDQSDWGQWGQLPWVLSGFTGSFSQLGKR